MEIDARHLDVGAYVLGVLDEAHVGLFEVHLAQCDDCADELATLLPVASLLADVDLGAAAEEDEREFRQRWRPRGADARVASVFAYPASAGPASTASTASTAARPPYAMPAVSALLSMARWPGMPPPANVLPAATPVVTIRVTTPASATPGRFWSRSGRSIRRLWTRTRWTRTQRTRTQWTRMLLARALSRRGRLAIVASALAILVGGMAFLAGVQRGASVTPPRGGTGESNSGITPAPALVMPGAAELFDVTDHTTGVRARLAVTTTPWGSSIELFLSGIHGPLQGELVAVDAQSNATVVASWTVPAPGYGVDKQPLPLHIQASTAATLTILTRFEVRAVNPGAAATTLAIVHL